MEEFPNAIHRATWLCFNLLNAQVRASVPKDYDSLGAWTKQSQQEPVYSWPWQWVWPQMAYDISFHVYRAPPQAALQTQHHDQQELMGPAADRQLLVYSNGCSLRLQSDRTVQIWTGLEWAGYSRATAFKTALFRVGCFKHVWCNHGLLLVWWKRIYMAFRDCSYCSLPDGCVQRTCILPLCSSQNADSFPFFPSAW